MPSLIRTNNCYKKKLKKCAVLYVAVLLFMYKPGISEGAKCGRPGKTTATTYELLGASFNENDVIRYKCKESDKVIFDYTERRCQSNGSWSNEIPVCSKLAAIEAIHSLYKDATNTEHGNSSTCSDVSKENPTNFMVKLVESSNIAAVRFSFLSEKLLDIQVTVQNGSNEEYCKSKIVHSDFTGISTGTVTFYCPAKTFGNYVSLTQNNGDIRICEIKILLPPVSSCLSPDIPAHGNGRKTVSQPEKYYFQCEPGYKLFGDVEVTCQNGRWFPKSPYCEQIYCDVPNNFKNGYIENISSKGRILYSGTIKYICNEGYYLEGHSTLKCVRWREWDYQEPVCKPKSRSNPNLKYIPTTETWRQFNATHCDTLPYITNGVLIFNSTNVGSTAYLKCSEGFQPSSDDYVSCLTTGKWSSKSLHCKKITCENFIHNDNTPGEWLSVNGSTYIRVLICSEDYYIEGSPAVIRCLPDGSWSYTSAKCIKSSNFWGSSWTPSLILVAAIGVGAVTAILIICLFATFLVIRKRHKSQKNTSVFHLENTSEIDGIENIHKYKHQSAVGNFESVERRSKSAGTNPRKPRSALPTLPIDADPVYAQPFEIVTMPKKKSIATANKKDDLYNTHIYAEPVNSIMPMCTTTSRIGTNTRMSIAKANISQEPRTSVQVEKSCDKKCAIYDSSSNSTLNSGQYTTEEKYQKYDEKPQFGSLTKNLEYLELF